MTTRVRFEDIQIVDFRWGSTSEMTEETYILSIGGEQHRYCSFSTDNFSGAQWEDENGSEVDGPDLELIEFPSTFDEQDRQSWVTDLIEKFLAAHNALRDELVEPAERALRERLYPWSAAYGG